MSIAVQRVRTFPREVAGLLRERGPKAGLRALRLTGAAIAAYLVADQLFAGTRPLLAPLTALLVVQVTLYSTLTAGLQRVASVVTGVLVAVGFSAAMGFAWWSLAALIAASIVAGQLLRLREHLLEVPISAMLVLAISGREGPASGRVTETLVGAAVGVLYTVVLPGPVQTRTAGEAVERLAKEIADLLRRMADEVVDGVSASEASRWLEATRQLSRRVVRADEVLVHAEESRRLNVRAVGTIDTAPAMRSGLDALEHCSVALRGLCRSIVDRVAATADEETAYSPEVREIFAVLLHDLATAVECFGRLVRGEAEAAADLPEAPAMEATDAVREARARLTELLLMESADDPRLWELHGSLLAGVERVLREIDVEEFARQRDRRRREAVSRARAVQVVGRLRATSRTVTELPSRRRSKPPPD